MSTSAKLPFSKTTASVLLDATRAIAALLVCLQHWRAILFVPFYTIRSSDKVLVAIPYVITSAGLQAVMVFFVLSGYLISSSIYRMMNAGKWNWRRYFAHRLVRLWIVLVPALVLGAGLDFTGFHLNHAPALYSGHVPNSLDIDVTSRFTLNRFLACLFFLQGIVTKGVFGSNGPLWSLSFEFWYYILFPLGLIALRPSFAKRVRVGSALCFVIVAFFVGHDILGLFPVWLLGSLLAAIRIPKVAPLFQKSFIAIYPFLFFGISRTTRLSMLLSNYALGVTTLIFLLCLLQADSVAPSSRWVSVSRLGSRFSYTLYAVHFPLLVLLTSFMLGDGRWYPTIDCFFRGTILLSAVVVYAFAVAWLTEFRTDNVRTWVESRILS